MSESLKSNPICPTCLYELTGLELDQSGHVVCPECGRKDQPITLESITQEKSRCRRLDLKLIIIMLFFLLTPILIVLITEYLTN